MNLIVILVAAAVGATIATILLWNRKPEAPERPRSLVERENRLKAGFEEAPVGIAFLNPQTGQWLQFNTRFSAAFGYSRDTLLRTSYRELTHPEDRKVETKYLRQLQDGSIPNYTMEKRVQQRDGKYRLVRVAVSLCRVGGEEFINCVAENSEEWRQTQAKVEFLENLIEAADDRAVFSIDPAGIITNWNRGAEKLFGYTRGEAIGMSRSHLYADSDRADDAPSRDLRRATTLGRMSDDGKRRHKDGHEVLVAITVDAEKIGDEVIRYVESARVATTGPNLEQYREAYDRLKETSERRINGMLESIDGYRAEIQLMQGQVHSLTESVEEQKAARTEITNELKLVTDALRRELGARRAAEQVLKNARKELAALDAKWKEKLAEEEQQEQADELDVVEHETSHDIFDTGEMWGPIGDGKFEKVLRELGEQRRTGTLLVAHERLQKEIYLEKGRIFSCASNDPRFYLTETLIRDGIVTEEQRARAIEMKKETKLSLGRILLLMNAISEEQLVESMREKVETEVRDLCTWREGKYFFSDGPVPSLQLVPLRIRVDALFEKIDGATDVSLEESDATVRDRPESSVSAVDLVDAPAEQPQRGGDRRDEFEEIAMEQPLVEQPSLFADVSRHPTQPQTTEVPPTPADIAGYAEHEEETGWEEVTDVAPVHVVEQEHQSALEYARREEESGWEEVVEPAPAHVAGPEHAAIAEPGAGHLPLFVGSSAKKSMKYHRTSCKSAKNITAKLRVDFATAADAEARGLKPCRTCIKQ